MTTRYPDLFTDPDQPAVEPLTEGGTWLLDLVACVDHLRRGYRLDLTVWDALCEAVAWAHDPAGDVEWALEDPLGTALGLMVAHSGHDTARSLQAAVRRWVIAMAHTYNRGHHWPHPTARRGFPPPEIPAA